MTATHPAARWHSLRTTGGLATIVRLGAEHGVPPDRCLAGTGLKAADLADPEREILASQEIQGAANLLDACAAPGLGLIAGSRLHFTAYGVLGLGLVSSPTARDAASFGLRYLDLTYAMTDVRVESDAAELRIVLDAGRLPHKVRTFFVERDMASVVTLQREILLTTAAPRRVHFTHRVPPHVGRYRTVFGVDPVFAAARDLVALDAALLDLPLPMADEHTVRRSEQAVRELADRRRTTAVAPASFAAQVHAELVRNPSAGLEDVATRLTASPRTVRRRLAEESTGFRRLQEEVRAELAERMLADGVQIKDISQRLGYAEPAAFIHAFQRWKGVSPGHYRRHSSPRRRS